MVHGGQSTNIILAEWGLNIRSESLQHLGTSFYFGETLLYIHSTLALKCFNTKGESVIWIQMHKILTELMGTSESVYTPFTFCTQQMNCRFNYKLRKLSFLPGNLHLITNSSSSSLSWLLSNHSTIKPWLMKCCWDGRPFGMFSLLLKL